MPPLKRDSFTLVQLSLSSSKDYHIFLKHSCIAVTEMFKMQPVGCFCRHAGIEKSVINFGLAFSFFLDYHRFLPTHLQRAVTEMFKMLVQKSYQLDVFAGMPALKRVSLTLVQLSLSSAWCLHQ